MSFNIDGPPIVMLVLFPLIFPAIFMILSAGVFRLSFSAFGPQARTPLPSRPIDTATGSSGTIGWMSATIPFISWMVYSEGVGFKLFGIGSGFVNFSEVRSLKEGLLFGCKVIHVSEEVRSPLRIQSRRICRAIDSQLENSQDV